MFALAKIAGHSTITITQKYVHPEADTIDEVFSRLSAGRKDGTAAKQKEKGWYKIGRKSQTAKNPPSAGGLILL